MGFFDWLFKREEERFSCNECNSELSSRAAVQCKYCHKTFCQRHSKPKKHNCKEWKNIVLGEDGFCQSCFTPIYKAGILRCPDCKDYFCYEHLKPNNHNCSSLYKVKETKPAEKRYCDICDKFLSKANGAKCSYCEGYFCKKHHMPEKHNCKKQPHYNPHSREQPTKESLPYV